MGEPTPALSVEQAKAKRESWDLEALTDTEEVLSDKQTAVLAEWMEQELSPVLTNVYELVPDDKELTEAAEDIRGIMTKLKDSLETRLVKLEDNEGWDFAFSKTITPTPTHIQPAESVSFDVQKTRKGFRAFNNKVRNPYALILGYSELKKFIADEDKKPLYQTLHDKALPLAGVFHNLTDPDYKVTFTKNAEGKISFTSLPIPLNKQDTTPSHT